jgi:hypothetical protein
MPLPQVGAAQSAEGVEALEEGLRERGEARPVTDVLEPMDEGAAGPIDNLAVALVQDPGGLQVLDVAEELFAVEVRESESSRNVHPILRSPTVYLF